MSISVPIKKEIFEMSIGSNNKQDDQDLESGVSSIYPMSKFEYIISITAIDLPEISIFIQIVSSGAKFMFSENRL